MDRQHTDEVNPQPGSEAQAQETASQAAKTQPTQPIPQPATAKIPSPPQRNAAPRSNDPFTTLPPWEWGPQQPQEIEELNPFQPADAERRCTHVKKDGTRCKCAPIKGGDVCPAHGGRLPSVKNEAALRLVLLAEPAMQVLYDVMQPCVISVTENAAYCSLHGLNCPDWATKVSAAKAVLDRTGFGPKSTIAIEQPVNDFASMSTADLAAELQDLADEVRLRMASRLAQPQPLLADAEDVKSDTIN